MVTVRLTAWLSSLLVVLSAASAGAQVLQLNASASGNTVSASWNAVPGATVYGLEALMQGGPYIPPTPLGGATSVQLPNIPAGTYFLRAWASNGALSISSNIVTVSVALPGASTPAPSNLTAQVQGNAVLVSWSLPTTAGLAAIAAEILSGPGGAILQQIPVRVSTSAYLPHVPNGIYTLRLRGFGASGFSAPSNEVNIAVPGCAAAAAIPLNVQTGNGSVSLSWPALPGVINYHLNASTVPGGSPNLLSAPLPASMTSLNHAGLPSGTYYVTLMANMGCGVASSGEKAITIVNDPSVRPRGPAIPNPCPNYRTACHPSQYPNLAQAEQIVHAVGRQYPGDLRNSCVEHGGNNTFLFRVVQALRQVDTRWGLMWKRRQVGDMSQDVIAYQFSAAPDEGSDQMYAWDIIAGHCGSPSTWFNNISSLNPSGGIWTLQPYIRAGFQP